MSNNKHIGNHTIDLEILLKQLRGHPKDTRISFGGLDFYQVKNVVTN